ncbi:hypothetical protein [Cylindrospermum stagnale]|nr:hypothetical protein [Cylindrospermum stagnale]
MLTSVAIAGTVAIGTGLQNNAATMTTPLATMPIFSTTVAKSVLK